jgi:hypothetical protein
MKFLLFQLDPDRVNCLTMTLPAPDRTRITVARPLRRTVAVSRFSEESVGDLLSAEFGDRGMRTKGPPAIQVATRKRRYS